MKTTRHYYKYYTTGWTQPKLTANIVPTDGFCAWNGYSSFYPNTSNVSIYQNEVRGWMEIYMYSHEYSIRPSSFTFYVVNSTDASSPAYNIKFYGTNEAWVMNTPIPNGCNNSKRNSINTGEWAAAWTLLGSLSSCDESKTGTIDMSSVTESYRYFRFEASQKGKATNDRLTIKNFHLYGSKVITIGGTSSDYDFYIDKCDSCNAQLTDNGIIEHTNYYVNDLLRYQKVSDTLTYKETSSTATYSTASMGKVYSNTSSSESSATISATTAYNPTNGGKRVRPISAVFTVNTTSSQFSYGNLLAFREDAAGTKWSTVWNASNNFSAVKGTYNITWANTSFHYWWAIVPSVYGWKSGTQTLSGTLSNVVWEVEDTGSHEDKDYKFYIVDNGTTTGTNYYINNFLRPAVVSDTITSKITNSGNTHTVTSSNIGTIYSGADYPHTAFTTSVDTTKAFNPTLGDKRVRPISATISVTTKNADIQQAYLQAVAYNSDGSYVTNFRSLPNQDNEGSYFDATTKGTYPVHFSYVGNENFNYWWAFSMHSAGYSSDNTTVVCTLSNIVWEVENTCSTVPDKKYYIFQP